MHGTTKSTVHTSNSDSTPGVSILTRMLAGKRVYTYAGFRNWNVYSHTKSLN